MENEAASLNATAKQATIEKSNICKSEYNKNVLRSLILNATMGEAVQIAPASACNNGDAVLRGAWSRAK